MKTWLITYKKGQNANCKMIIVISECGKAREFYLCECEQKICPLRLHKSEKMFQCETKSSHSVCDSKVSSTANEKTDWLISQWATELLLPALSKIPAPIKVERVITLQRSKRYGNTSCWWLDGTSQETSQRSDVSDTEPESRKRSKLPTRVMSRWILLRCRRGARPGSQVGS